MLGSARSTASASLAPTPKPSRMWVSLIFMCRPGSRVMTLPISTSPPPLGYLVSAWAEISTPRLPSPVRSNGANARPAPQVLSSAVFTPCARQFTIGKVFARAVGVVRDQHFVAGLKQGQGHVGNGGKAAGHQHALQAALQRTQALLQDERGGRAVQPIGVAAFVLPFARAHGRDVGKDDGGGLVHPRLGRYETSRRNVVMVDDAGGEVCVVLFHADHGSAPPGREPGRRVV